MEDGDEGLLDARRRTLLKGMGAGALGAAGLGTAWSAAPGLLGDGNADHADRHRILALVAPKDVTHTATGGRWAAADAWKGGEKPGADARVRIPEETTVTLDHEVAADLVTVRVDGTLRVDPASDSRLALDTLVVTDTGRLEVGTPDDPIEPDSTVSVRFRDRGPIDESWDPDRVSRGLLTLGGASVRIHGAEKTGWSTLATHPTAGDSTLQLPAAPTGWRPGDTLVVAGLHPEENQDEEVTVAGVDGTTVRFEETLSNDHVPPQSDLDSYVANLDRNVRFRSANRVVGRRGHVMFMGTDVDVRHAGFYELGRTEKARPFTDPANGVPPKDVPPNPQARYSCHFHRTGVDTDERPRRVEGCVAWGSPGWGFVNHDSYVEFVENVSYEVFGAGFVGEIGTEVGAVRRNFALRSQGSGGLPDSRQFHADSEGQIDDFGHGGHGFWFQGPGVAVEDNVAGGHRHFGFVFWTRGKPDETVDPDRIEGVVGTVPTFPLSNVEGQPGLSSIEEASDGTVPPSFVKLRSFRGNTVFGSGGGLDISRHRFGASNDGVDEPSVVEDVTVYNIGSHGTHWDPVRVPNTGGGQGGNNGISIRYSKHVDLRGVRLVNGAGGSRGIGINHNDAPVSVRVADATVEGWTVGLRSFPHGTSPVRGVTFDNEVDVQLIGGGIDSRWAPQRVAIEDVSFADGGRANVFLTAELEGDLYGLFSPQSLASLDGEALFHDAQRDDFVPIPTPADLESLHGDSLGNLSDADPAALVGKTNAELWNEFGVAVDGGTVPPAAGRDGGIEGGFVTGGAGGGRRNGLIEHVVSAAGSLFEVGRLAQGEKLYVYDDPEFLAVPGTYAGLPYVRPEREDAGGERASFYHLRLSRPATVYVAYNAESSADWLGNWTDTGDSLGTDDGPRRVYRRKVDAGRVTLGPPQNTYQMYSVFARER